MNQTVSFYLFIFLSCNAFFLDAQGLDKLTAEQQEEVHSVCDVIPNVDVKVSPVPTPNRIPSYVQDAMHPCFASEVSACIYRERCLNAPQTFSLIHMVKFSHTRTHTHR